LRTLYVQDDPDISHQRADIIVQFLSEEQLGLKQQFSLFLGDDLPTFLSSVPHCLSASETSLFDMKQEKEINLNETLNDCGKRPTY
jgi:hypothetical protein